MSATGIGATPSADATSATPTTNTISLPASGATPAPAPTTPPAAPAPATGDPAALGDAGQRALQAERQAAADARREAAEARAELQKLQEAGQSDQEKAIAAAAKEASTAERTRLHGQMRTAEVRSALRVAGLANAEAMPIALADPVFQKLKVNDDGEVEGLDAAVEAFKAKVPELFRAPAAPVPGGAWDGDKGGTTGKQPATLDEAITAEYAKRK